MFASTFESIHASPAKQAVYTRWILALLALCLVLKTAWFSRIFGWSARVLVDFDAFHIIAQRVWIGDLDQAYQFTKLVVMQREASGGLDSFMPWTYPPQFSLLLAPFAFIPTGPAYLLFTASTLACFLVVLRRLIGGHFVLLLVMLFPAIQITMACGQNGFLTATLIGLVCMFFDRRPALAGLALGAMIIKPHLAITFALYAILTRRWTIVATAGAVVLASSAVCTAIFGIQIWTGLLLSVHDSAAFLKEGYYPLFRMISFYAALRTAGCPAWMAFAGQCVLAIAALGTIAVAVWRGTPTRSALGLTAMLSVCISPYVYDYDFVVAAIGLGLLLPTLLATASTTERGAIYALVIVIGGYGTVRAAQLGSGYSDYQNVLSVGGFAVAALIALVLISLRRAASPIPAAANTKLKHSAAQA
jgi:hypothetical protein